MNKFSELEPKQVWEIFEEITLIPRPSKHETLMQEYLRRFAADRNLALREDKKGNIVILKPASAGYEDMAPVILQSHMDMVCEKDADRDINFETDPIDAYVDGDWVKARGTTLGADCGIGMALQLAVLADQNLAHPAIEALFTVDEEQGLTGAMSLGEEMLTGTRMINLDSEDEGEIFIGCAGGVDTIAHFAYKPKKAPRSSHQYYNIKVCGLHGGHSGDDIHKGYANANKILTRLLWYMMNHSDIRLASIDGGNLRNAIPRQAVAQVAIPSKESHDLLLAINQLATEIKAEYRHSDPAIEIVVEPISACDHVMGRYKANLLIASLQSLANGVIAMSHSMEGLVETSSNLASIKMAERGLIVVTTSQRSSIESAKEDIANTIESTFLLAGAEVSHTDGYPGWEPNTNSSLVASATSIYRRLFDKEPLVKAIHAGLECGLLLNKYPHLDIISIGPTLRGVHSPSEKLQISTVSMIWCYLTELLSDK